jgi:DNA-binding NtrC family response regulator
MRRVVIGEFGEVPGMALRRILEQQGLTVAGQGMAAEIIPLVDEARPDLLLLDLDDADTQRIAAQACARLPSLTVIAWSASEPVMRVFPAGHPADAEVSPLTLARLTAALNGAPVE